MWKNVYEKVFLEHPLTGIGTQSIKFMRYIMRYNHAHNLIMTLLLQGGLIGEVLWWRSIFIGTSKLNIAKSIESIVATACIVIEFLTNIMDSTNDSYFFILVAIAFYIDKIVGETRSLENYERSCAEVLHLDEEVHERVDFERFKSESGGLW